MHKMTDIGITTFAIALPFLAGHLIGYSWLTWQRRKRAKQYDLDKITGTLTEKDQ